MALLCYPARDSWRQDRMALPTDIDCRNGHVDGKLKNLHRTHLLIEGCRVKMHGVMQLCWMADAATGLPGLATLVQGEFP